MKPLLIVLVFLPLGNCFAQKFEFIVGLGTTYSFTQSNIDLVVEPDFSPSITLEDGWDVANIQTESIDWIQNKNYFGVEPSLEIGYQLGKEFSIGIGLFARKRQLRYDLYVPFFSGLALYSHQYKLDMNFIASTVAVKYKHPSKKWNAAFDIGFNHPLRKHEYLGEIYTTLGNYIIREDVVGPVKQKRSFSDFTLNPLARLSINKMLSNRIELGFSIEKQFKNHYGADIRVHDIAADDIILISQVYGSDLTLGLRLCYRLFVKNE